MASPILPSERLERVAAWGGATSSMSYVYRPTSPDDLAAVFDVARRHGVTVGLRGAGQSYGDASLNAEHLTLDCSAMTRVLDWDAANGVVRVEPGVTIGQLWRRVIGDGWWPYVVPGTMAVSAGGAAAMNIHGKNNWKVGPIGDHILDFELLLPSGERRRCSRTAHPDLFHAAIGGFGMLGCFVSLTLELKRVHSGLLEVEPVTAGSFAEMTGVFASRLGEADYLVGWVDCFARGPAAGRGLVHAARYLADGEDPHSRDTLRVDRQELPGTILGVLPKSAVWRFMRPVTNDLGVRAVNAVKYRLGRRESGHRFRQSHAAFAFLLDYVPGWKRAYGTGGLVQYQSFVPAADACAVFGELLERSHRAGIVPYLGVLKRHRPDPFWMTHAVDGFSLALDFRVTRPNRTRLWTLAQELDGVVTSAGGRFYFAKDSMLTPASVRGLGEEDRVRRFWAMKRACDPEGLLMTDLVRRVFPEQARSRGAARGAA
jgi:decaprenylphospho-beta-D-ribofuranose 2-oxidase